MTRLSLAAALTLTAVGSVLAADLSVPPPAAYVPIVVPTYNWSGIYLGVNGGYGFSRSEWSDPANLSAAGKTGYFSSSGFVVGPTLGVNFQFGAFVLGAEGDFDYSGIDGKDHSAFCNALGFGPAQCETKNTWLATARGRAGYALDRVLFYATAGGAFGNIEAGANGGLASSTKAGWTVGGGAEYALADTWTLRLEYLYVDLGNATCSQPNSCGFDGVPTPANNTVSFTSSLIRLGVDYKFR